MNLESVLLLNALNATEKAMEKQIKPIEDGGPAFPVPVTPTRGGGWASCKEVEGMTLRDWFAGQALACVAHEYIGGTTPKTALAEDCYEMADAMLAARKVKP